MDKEEFVWKAPKDIWKGVGIYHLTFRVVCDSLKLGTIRGRSKEEIAAVVQPLLDAGEACDASNPNYVAAVKGMAWVELTPFGKAIDNDLRHFQDKHKGTLICARKIMDNHIHVVVWVQKNIKQSIKQIAHGFRIGITHIAKDMGVWPVKVDGTDVDNAPVAQALGDINDLGDMNDPWALGDMNDLGDINDPWAEQEVVDVETEACHAERAAGLVLEHAFIRTLARKGQLRTMIDYVVLNPYRKYMILQHPELFTMHKDTEVKGLRFRSMGNHWLLDWPERQIVECSRSISEEDLQRLLKRTLEHAERGAITYTAAISKGEQMIARAVRESGWPLVVLMMDGFPSAGSESERYYKPGGVYFETCNNGKLLLLEAYNKTYGNPLLIARTEVAIKAKDEAKGCAYRPLPHDSKRWRLIAGNVILEMMCE